jgi:hypothetical protein
MLGPLCIQGTPGAQERAVGVRYSATVEGR